MGGKHPRPVHVQTDRRRGKRLSNNSQQAFTWIPGQHLASSTSAQYVTLVRPSFGNQTAVHAGNDGVGEGCLWRSCVPAYTSSSSDVSRLVVDEGASDDKDVDAVAETSE